MARIALVTGGTPGKGAAISEALHYSATKAGDLDFIRALALESARAGITVNAICPDYIHTRCEAGFITGSTLSINGGQYMS